MKLRQYQEAAVDAVYDHLRNRDDNPVAVLPTGAGKSLVLAKIASDAVQQWNGRVLVLAHVKELLEQNADKIRRLCPDVPVGTYSAGLKKRDTNTPVLVAGIQSIYKRACDLDPFDLVVVDECFPAGTPIATPRGVLPIEDLHVGQSVYTALGVGTIEAISARHTRKLVELELEDGTTLRCTPNHRFFTKCGWTEAGALEVGARLYSREDVSVLRRSVPAQDLLELRRQAKSLHVGGGVESEAFLLPEVCGEGKTETCSPQTGQAPNVEEPSSSCGQKDLPLLRERVPAVDQTGSHRSDSGLHERKTLGAAAILLHLLFEESGESHVDSWNEGESEQEVKSNSSFAEEPGRKWAVDGTSDLPAGAIGSGLAAGVCCASARRPETRNAEALQARHRESKAKDRDRTGRAISWESPSSQGRQKEDSTFASQRVVRLETIECESPVPVFNLQVSGHPSYYAQGVLTHNCHLISKSGDGMYRQFLSDCRVINPHVRVIGLTATPFRLDSGMICSDDHFLNHVCYDVGIKELIRDGYLCPLVSKAGVNRADFGGLHVRAGEFISEEVESLMNEPDLVTAACGEIVEYTRGRKAVLIFASSVAHGRQVVDVLRQKHGIECGFVCGETPTAERDELLARFRGEATESLFAQEPLRYLCNVNVLTTGFDAPRVDCVVMLRPTLSPGLLYQCVGRGFRLHPDKQNCLVLDFGGNFERHGPIDQIKPKEKQARGSSEPPAKECQKCHALVACGYANCPECGHPFPPPERETHDARASEAGVLSGEITDVEYEVQDVIYRIHRKRDAPEDAPRCLRVDYMIGLDHWQSEFICVEHSGYAKAKAVRWWAERCLDPLPDDAEDALEMADAGLLAFPERITVRSIAGQRYDRIIKYELGEIPNEALEEAPF